MLFSAMYVLVVAQSSSEVPEGLMNNPVFVNAWPNVKFICEYMVFKYKININRCFLNVTNSEYFDITTTHFVYNHVNWKKVK